MKRNGCNRFEGPSGRWLPGGLLAFQHRHISVVTVLVVIDGKFVHKPVMITRLIALYIGSLKQLLHDDIYLKGCFFHGKIEVDIELRPNLQIVSDLGAVETGCSCLFVKIQKLRDEPDCRGANTKADEMVLCVFCVLEVVKEYVPVFLQPYGGLEMGVRFVLILKIEPVSTVRVDQID